MLKKSASSLGKNRAALVLLTGRQVGSITKQEDFMSNTKEIERAELHKTIWRIANELRGSVDGWDFKSYVLGMLFYRFLSENLTSYLNAEEARAGNEDFNYALLGDKDAEYGREEVVREKGFYILPSEFSTMYGSRPGRMTISMKP